MFIRQSLTDGTMVKTNSTKKSKEEYRVLSFMFVLFFTLVFIFSIIILVFDDKIKMRRMTGK